MTLFIYSIWSCGLIWELKHNLMLTNDKMLTNLNAKCSKPCLPFWASWIPMLYLWSTKCTHVCSFFHLWIKISDGYQMTVGMRTTQKISRFESTSWFVPVLEVPRSRVIFYFPLVLYKTKWCIKRDVRYTVMILSVICRLMCAMVPGAHIRFMHSILSLKWSVTLF
jgi:hypothetical protein